MSVFRTSDDELFINALVLTAKGASGRPGYSLARWAGPIFKLGVLLSCINLTIVSLGIVSMFLFRFPTRLNIDLFAELFVWSVATGAVATLSPMILGSIRTGLDFEAAKLDVALSKLFYLNFVLVGVNLLVFATVLVIGERLQRSDVLSLFAFSALCVFIVLWSGYCYLQVSRMSWKHT